MEDPAAMSTDTTWSIGRAMPQIPITEITAPDNHILQEPDNHILQEPDNLSAIAHGDPIVIPTDTPQLFGKAPSHNSVSDTRIPDIQISSRPDNSSYLAHTITKLADSVTKLNQLLQKEREKSERLLCENFTLKTKNLELQSCIENNAESGKSPKGNDFTATRKAMEIRTSLISDAERFHRDEINAIQFAIETCNNEHSTNPNKETQIATEVETNKKSRPAEKDRNQIQFAPGKNKNNTKGKNRSEQQQKQDFSRGKQTRNRTSNQGTNKAGNEQHPSESNSNKKKFKVLIIGDSQLRRVDESKLSNSHRDVEKRFQPGMRIGQAVEKAGKSNSDVIIVHAATNNVASSTPEKLCEETVRTLKKIQANNPKAKVVFSSIFKRKDNMALNNKVKKVNEFLETELALNGLDMIDNSNIMFSNLWDDGLHINDGGIRKFSGNISSFVKYC